MCMKLNGYAQKTVAEDCPRTRRCWEAECFVQKDGAEASETNWKFFVVVSVCFRVPVMSAIARNIAKVLAHVKEVCTASKIKNPVRLVAVSKTKPVEDLQEAYDAGQRHFGENYVQELVAKAPELPNDIQWHFIGNLQSNKCKLVAAIKNLYIVETVDKPSLAKALNKACTKVGRATPLNVLVQVMRHYFARSHIGAVRQSFLCVIMSMSHAGQHE